MSIKIACVGDVMPGGVLHYEKHQDFCSAEILMQMAAADIRVATLETAVGDVPDFDPEKMKRDKDVIYCPTDDLKRLSTLGINVVSLANNHAWDLGLRGIENAKRALDSLGIKYSGAGRNQEEAQAPAVVEVKGKKVAFIAYCEDNPGTCGYIPVASDGAPGINAAAENSIKENITRIRNHYDYVFVIMHWGKEYYYYPTPEVNALARKIIDWGADGVIGSHSHQIQPSIIYKGKPIIFSLGNFFFPDRFITSPRSTFYPDGQPETENYPRTLGYPFVDAPTFKIWKPVARVGKIATLEVSPEKSVISESLTEMDADSHLGSYGRPKPLMYRLSHTIVRLPAYSFVFFSLRTCRFIRKKLKGEL